MMEKRAVREVGETSVDLRKYSIKDTGGRSRKKHEDPRRACMKKLMTVDEAKVIYRDRSVWRSVLSDYPAMDKA